MTIKRTAAIIGAAAALAIPAATAQAAPLPYHVKNSGSSNYSLNIYSGTGCTGSVHVLYTGQTATSTGWDSMRASKSYEEAIYDDVTGAFLAERSYAAFKCVNLSDNSHYVWVHNS